MTSKYRIGQRFVFKTGEVVRITHIERSVHGNNSLLTLESESGKPFHRPVRTSWLSKVATVIDEDATCQN